MFAMHQQTSEKKHADSSKTKGALTPAQRGPVVQSGFVLQRSVGNSRLQTWAAQRTVSGSSPRRIQRQCGCGGACASCASKDETQRVQTQLTVGPAHDVYEQEADRVADSILRMPETSFDTETQGLGASIQRIGGGEGGGFDPGPGFQAQQTGGQSLSSSTRGFMEARFGTDFGAVRVHTDSAAQASAYQIQARAYTVGNHITLGNGASENDKHLMAHELTHVVQQGGAGKEAQRSPLSPRIQRDPPQQACPGGTKTITVDLVSLDGSTRDAPGDLDFANKVFKPCCVQFQLGVGLSTTQANSSTWLGGDTDLNVGNCGAASQEELDTYNGAAAAHGTTGRFRTFYVASISSGARADSYPPYCATGTAAPLSGMVSVTNSGASRSLAHEFGHILINSASHTGIDNPADTGNLMVPTNTSTGEALDATQCTTIFGNA